MDGEEVSLRKLLLDLSSRAASLHFRLITLYKEARVETIRLSGLLSFCETYTEGGHPLRKEVEGFLRRYVLTSD